MGKLSDEQLQKIQDHIQEGKSVTALLHDPAPWSVISDLIHEVFKWRRLYLDKPEDRLWHDSDKTWWTRRDDSHLGVGGLFRAEPPEPVKKLAEAAEALLPLLDELAKDENRDVEIQSFGPEAEKHAQAIRKALGLS